MKILRLTLTTVRAQLDNLWSIIVRRLSVEKYGPLCAICRSRPIEVGYHIVPKQRGRAIRWLIENGCGACSHCNDGELNNRSLYRDKHVEIFGKEIVEGIEAAARIADRRSLADLIELRDYFKSVIESGRYDRL